MVTPTLIRQQTLDLHTIAVTEIAEDRVRLGRCSESVLDPLLFSLAKSPAQRRLYGAFEHHGAEKGPVLRIFVSRLLCPSLPGTCTQQRVEHLHLLVVTERHAPLTGRGQSLDWGIGRVESGR